MEADGVVFVIDGSDDSRFDEVREIVDDLWTRWGLNEAGLPIIQKAEARGARLNRGSSDDIEGGGEDQSVEQVLKGLPVLFLMNKNDKKEFKGIEQIQKRLELSSINCIESVCLAVSALDANGVDAALSWIYRAAYENSLIS